MNSTRYNRLRWLCRRGMKELDVLLEGFLERESEALNRGGFPQLETLLETEDDTLWDWLQARADPDSDELRQLVKTIRGRP